MFGSLLRISVRNVTRNFRRSLITATAVLIGTFFIISARGLLNGLQSGIIKGFTETQAGDLQLHHPGYLEANEALPLDKSFAMDGKLKEMLGKVPEVRAYTGRIQFSGMLSNGEDTTLFVGQAVDPTTEYTVCPRNKLNIFEGKHITPDVPNGVVVGRALAEALKAKVGSELTILVDTGKGLNGIDVVVVGLAEFKLPGIANKVVHVPLETAQKLLYMPGRVTEVLVNVEDIDQVVSVEAKVKQLLAGEFKSLNLVSNTWMDVGQLYLTAIKVQDDVLIWIIAVLFVVMIAGIVNTMLMSVFERVREIGTMMAIGIRRWKILLMFLFESVSLSGMGAIAGVGLGALTVSIFHSVGMPLPALGNSTPSEIYPFIRLWYMGLVTGIALVTAIVAALYPAFRASRMRPAEALRTL